MTSHKLSSSVCRRAASSMIESLHLPGLSRAMTIRRFQSGSSQASFVRRASLKSRLMMLSKVLMMNLSIDLHLTSVLRSTTPCLALRQMFRCAEFNRYYSVKVLASQSSLAYCASSIYQNANYLTCFKCSVRRSAVATTAAACKRPG